MVSTTVSGACYCGSGRTLAHCHELPRRARRRRRAELDALGEAHDLAALFPAVRPRDAVFELYATRAADALDPLDPTVPVDAVENGIRLLDDLERRRIVAEWATNTDRWDRIVEVAGDIESVERAVVAGSVRITLLERRPLATHALAPLEGGALRHLPANALTLLVPPMAVWSMDEAIAACALLTRPPRFDPEWFDAVERYAGSRAGPEHIQRLRGGCARIAAQLPVTGLPRASETVAAGAAEIADDETWAEAIAARLLAVYAASPGPTSEMRAQAARRSAHATV